ncbi:MAG: apolipoprotein N-acyltransferase, partial [Methylococcales bacterium]
MTRILPSKIRFWLLPLLSGVFIGTSYIPFPPWASLFCFVPLWLFWQQQTSLKTVILGGMVTAFIFTLIGFNWMTYLLHEFAHLDWPVAVIGMIVYALIAHLYVPIAGALWFLGRRKWQWREPYNSVLMALIMILCEANSLTLFDWNFGYSWYGAGIPLYQWAEVVGFSGLSAFTLLVNLALFIAWQHRANKLGRNILTRVIVGFAIVNVGGWMLKNRVPQPDATFTTLLVQASIENSEKLAAELGKGYAEEIFKCHVDLTDKALNEHKDRKIDFAMWPETAFPALLGAEFKDDKFPAALAEFIQQRQLPLITGAYSVDQTSRLVTNSLFILNQAGAVLEPHYSKTILLAFGEYIPGEQWFPELRNWLPPTGHFARGAGPTELLQWNGYKMGAQICYESLFPQ